MTCLIKPRTMKADHDSFAHRIASCFAVLLVALGCLSVGPAHAGFPATNTNNCTVAPCYTYRQSAYSPNTDHSTFAAACSAYAAAISANSANYNGVVVSAVSPNCITDLYTKAGAYVTRQGAAGVSIITGSPQYSCPANSTLSGTTCTCSGTYVEVGSSCVAPAAEWKVTLDALNFLGNPLTRPGTDLSLTACYLGYEVTGSGASVRVEGGLRRDGVEIYGPFRGTGVPCTADPAGSVAPSPCKPGTFPGTINGVSVCVPGASESVVAGPSSAASGAGVGAPVGGSGGVPVGAVTAENTTSCSGGECTTGTTYRDGSGAVVGTGTKTETQASFCTANPAASICAPQESECEKNPDAAGCAELDTPPTDGIPTSTVGVTFTAETPFAGEGSCPANATMASGLLGQTVTVWDWSVACSYAPALRALIMALASFAAFLIVSGVRGAEA